MQRQNEHLSLLSTLRSMGTAQHMHRFHMAANLRAFFVAKAHLHSRAIAALLLHAA
jgi:hypothetical protein